MNLNRALPNTAGDFAGGVDMKKFFAALMIVACLLTTGNCFAADLQQEIQRYTQMIQTDPNNADAYIDRGNAYFELGQLERALED